METDSPGDDDGKVERRGGEGVRERRVQRLRTFGSDGARTRVRVQLAVSRKVLYSIEIV